MGLVWKEIEMKVVICWFVLHCYLWGFLLCRLK
jgi:hypothetical protein